MSIGTALANSVEFCGIRPQMYIKDLLFDNVMLTLHYMTLQTQELCQNNNKCDCSDSGIVPGFPDCSTCKMWIFNFLKNCHLPTGAKL